MSIFANLCTPALVYLGISVLSIVIALTSKISIGAIVIKSFFALIWVWFLNLLCSKGLTTVSWVLVLLPYIIIVLTILFVVDHLDKSTNPPTNPQQQQHTQQPQRH